MTLTEKGELKECIGFPYPHLPLDEAVREAALSAALQNPRFPQVRAAKLHSIRVEVTVLSVPERMEADPASRPGAVKVT